jgi:hypothetical protein
MVGENIEAESCFYSVCSDDSMLLALKVRETFVEFICMNIVADTKKWFMHTFDDHGSAKYNELVHSLRDRNFCCNFFSDRSLN